LPQARGINDFAGNLHTNEEDALLQTRYDFTACIQSFLQYLDFACIFTCCWDDTSAASSLQGIYTEDVSHQAAKAIRTPVILRQS